MSVINWSRIHLDERKAPGLSELSIVSFNQKRRVIWHGICVHFTTHLDSKVEDHSWNCNCLQSNDFL